MKNKFRIVIPSYNNQRWVDYNLKSLLNQTYKNYEVYYVDDCSTDETVRSAKNIVKNDPRFIFIENKKNMGALYNYVTYLVHDLSDDNTILCLLDGDDWLYDITVLEKINDFYNKNNVWMTYGGMTVYTDSGFVDANPQNSPYSDVIHKTKSYRKDVWRASHFRTYRAFLWKAIQDIDLREIETGNYYDHASDLGFQFPCLEMCPKEKIGVVPFITYAYNASQQNLVRTHHRQLDNKNWMMETEIRDRKRYREGIMNGKYPQVNVYGYPYQSDYIPKEFTFVQNKTYGEFDVTLITDFEIPNYIRGELQIKNGKIVADLHEGRFYSNMDEIYEMVYQNHTMFDLILTHDPKLLTLPNSKLRFAMSRHHLTYVIDDSVGSIKIQDDSLCVIHNKTKNISCISSNKDFLPGHTKRLQFVNHISNRNTKTMFDMFGIGFQEITGKIDGLKDYRFSIAIENSHLENMATEKISDCFLTGTIPIYYGCPNIGDYFDVDGIISFQTESELEDIILELNTKGEEIYNQKINAVRKNYELVWNYSLNSDQHFEKYLRNLISK